MRAIGPIMGMFLVAGAMLFAYTALPQESPNRAVTANQPTETIVLQAVTATNGLTYYITMVRGSEWAACALPSKFYDLMALMPAPDKWNTRMSYEESSGSCVQADDLDLVLVGPAQNVSGALTVSFRDRQDVHASLAWYISCEAIPPVATQFCRGQE